MRMHTNVNMRIVCFKRFILSQQLLNITAFNFFIFDNNYQLGVVHIFEILYTYTKSVKTQYFTRFLNQHNKKLKTME